MDISSEEQERWETLTYEEKNQELYMRQVKLLNTFLDKGAISREQYNKSLHDLTVKMCISTGSTD